MTFSPRFPPCAQRGRKRGHSDFHKYENLNVPFSQQLAQHERQDAAVAVVIELDGRVDAALRLEALLRAVRRRRGHREGLSRCKVHSDAGDRVALLTREPEALAILARAEL